MQVNLTQSRVQCLSEAAKQLAGVIPGGRVRDTSAFNSEEEDPLYTAHTLMFGIRGERESIHTGSDSVLQYFRL